MASRVRLAPANDTNLDWAANGGTPSATRATCTRLAVPAGSGFQRNVCTQLTAMLVAGASAPTAATVTVALIDGVSGGTTYLWGPHCLSIAAVAGATNGVVVDCWIEGSINTAMTLEFSAGGGANTVESVSMNGTVV